MPIVPVSTGKTKPNIPDGNYTFQITDAQQGTWQSDKFGHAGEPNLTLTCLIMGITDEDGYSMASGSDRAVTRVAKEVRRLADELEFLVFLVGHMNNDGSMAGSAHLRHAVDATLTLQYKTDDKDPHRILCFEKKTRFGTPGRRALFVMRKDGLKDLGPYEDDDEAQEPETIIPRRNRDAN